MMGQRGERTGHNNNGDGDGEMTPWEMTATGIQKQGVTSTDEDDNRERMGMTTARG